MDQAIPRMMEEKPTPEQWGEVVHRFGQPSLVTLRWDRSRHRGVADHTPRTSNAVLFVTDPLSRVLLVRKRKDGSWFLPMGGIEREQSVLEGASKELMEEAGITLSAGGIPVVYVVEEVFADGTLTRWHLLVQGTTAAEAAEPRDTEEISEARFFSTVPYIADDFRREWLDDILLRVRRDDRYRT